MAQVILDIPSIKGESGLQGYEGKILCETLSHDMEIEIETVLDRRPEQDIKRPVELRDHIGDAAQELVTMRLHGGNHRLHMRRIERGIGAAAHRQASFAGMHFTGAAGSGSGIRAAAPDL